MTFDEALVLTDGVSGRAAYEIEALKGLWLAVTSIPSASTIVEVGCEYGRSTSLLAQVAKEQGHRLLLIDPFLNPECAPRLVEMLRKLDVDFVLFCMTTAEWQEYNLVPKEARLVHIDGDHRREYITFDCEVLLPIVPRGGFACFHDYGHDSLPDVFPVVNAFTQNEEWDAVGTFHTCRVMRRK